MVNWNSVLTEISENDTPVIKLNDERTVVRIVAAGQDDTAWYRQVRVTYDDRVTNRFLVSALVLRGSAETPNIRAGIVVFPMTVFKAVLSLLAEGMPLLDPVSGIPVAIKRTGQKMETRYTVVPHPKPFAIPAEHTHDFSVEFEAARAYLLRKPDASTGGTSKSSFVSDADLPF